MPTYSYRCPACGSFDVIAPMSRIPATPACPGCGESSRRVYAGPQLSSYSSAQNGGVALAEASAERPQVVTQLPAALGGAPRRAADPRHAMLPRP